MEFDFRRKRYQIVKSESEFSVKLIKSSIISDLSLDMQFLKGFLLLTSYLLIICMQIHTVVKLFNPLNLFFPHFLTVQLNCQIMKHQFINNFYFFILDISLFSLYIKNIFKCLTNFLNSSIQAILSVQEFPWITIK